MKNLVGCLVAGVVIFGLAVFRDIEVENQSVGAAVTTGLVAGGGIAVILGVMVVVVHSRERRSRVLQTTRSPPRTHDGVKSRLRLVPRDRYVQDVEWGVMTRRRFLDFDVDGHSFYDVLRERGMDLVSGLWLDGADDSTSADAVARLVCDAPGDLPDDRVAIFVCPECGDLGCGAITVRVVLGPSEVAWQEWGWQTDDTGLVDKSEVADLPTVKFDRAEYERTLRDWHLTAR